MAKWRWISGVLAGVVVTVSGAAAPQHESGSGAPPVIRVGLLTDAKCTDGKSREAAWRVLSTAPGLAADRISTEVLLTERLKDYDVIVFPGGTGGGQASLLGVEGGRAVTRFVAEGKGVVGICAGGYLVMEGWGPATRAIELINARNWAGENGNWARGEKFITVHVLPPGTPPAEITTAPITMSAVDEATSRTMWYENGPIFVPASVDGLPSYTPLVRFVTDLTRKGAPAGMMAGRDAVVAAPFGKGRVVAFSPHPELSPGLNHWLINAVRWAAAGNDGSEPTVETVLEGHQGTGGKTN